MGCLLEQNLCKDIYRINLDLFAIHIVSNLSGKLVVQLTEADQSFDNDGRILKRLLGSLELARADRQIMSNSI